MALKKPAQGPGKADAQNEEAQLDEILGRAAPSPKPSRPRRILWLIALSLLVFFLPLYLFDLSVTEDTKGLNSDLKFISSSLTLVPTPGPAVQKLLTPLAQAQSRIDQLNAVDPILQASRPDWPAIMGAVGNYNPDQITLSSISQTTTTLTITGRSPDDNAVTAYAHSLEKSGLFSRVVIQSMQIAVVTPTATLAVTGTGAPAAAAGPTGQPGAPVPTSKPTPPSQVAATATPASRSPVSAPTSVPAATATPAPASTATDTPTASPTIAADPCQQSGSNPLMIALGTAQTCVFNVDGDVDNVGFLAKGGHYYHVYTTNLTAGVDTYISLRAGSLSLNNDDATTGSLYSSITFQNAGSDTIAVVTISNRGIFGSTMAYGVEVDEVVATPTPAPSNTPTPTPSPSLVPTATSTSAPTATPDLRDAFEPDDTAAAAKTIYVGQTQEHSFYPAGDVDNVKFPVKSGRYYQVLTSNLALGVDTVVTVTVNGEQWTNDDYKTGSGNFASSVCFSTSADDTALATIADKSGSYGANMTYLVTASEISSLSASNCPTPPITPVPATSMFYAKPVRGLAAPIWTGADDQAGSDRLGDTSTYVFVIIAEIKIDKP